MKKSTDYLELVVCHKNGSCYDYPSRMCVIRVPFDKIHIFAEKTPVFDLSLAQVKKLFSIGFVITPEFYYVVPHRLCDYQFWDYNDLNFNKFCLSFDYYLNVYGDVLPSISSLMFKFDNIYNFSGISSVRFYEPSFSNSSEFGNLPF